MIEKILEKYNLPIRGGFESNIEYNKIIPMIDSFYDENVNIDYFKKNIDKIKEYDTVDIMAHPAFIDKELVNWTSYSLKRMDEYEILTSKEVKELLEENSIKVTNYGEI